MDSGKNPDFSCLYQPVAIHMQCLYCHPPCERNRLNEKPVSAPGEVICPPLGFGMIELTGLTAQWVNCAGARPFEFVAAIAGQA